MKITFIKDTDVIDLVTAADVMPLMCELDLTDEISRSSHCPRKWIVDDEAKLNTGEMKKEVS